MENQKQRIYDELNKMNIKYEAVEHEPVHTMEDMENLGLLDKGIVCKNLFVRDQKGKLHFVVSVPYDKNVKLDELGKKLGAGKLSFGSEERLEKYLKLKNGYVSPFGFINDESKSVIFVFDKDLVNKDMVAFHPNTNKALVYINFNDLKNLIEDHGNDVVFVRLF